jgi:hypothetical protein
MSDEVEPQATTVDPLAGGTLCAKHLVMNAQISVTGDEATVRSSDE